MKPYRILLNNNDMGYCVEVSEARALEVARCHFSHVKGAVVKVVPWNHR